MGCNASKAFVPELEAPKRKESQSAPSPPALVNGDSFVGWLFGLPPSDQSRDPSYGTSSSHSHFNTKNIPTSRPSTVDSGFKSVTPLLIATREMSEVSRNTNKRPLTADAGLKRAMTGEFSINKLPLSGQLPVLGATTDIGFAK